MPDDGEVDGLLGLWPGLTAGESPCNKTVVIRNR
jgi:hypothetical protein